MSLQLVSDTAKPHDYITVRDVMARRGFKKSITAAKAVYDSSTPNEPVTATVLPPSSEITVGIVGAGAAGLYSAMMLKDLGIKFEILEGSDRTGGRIKTHHFSEKPYDYYDVGAMRFPRLWFMRRLTIQLFEQLGITDKMVPYYMSPRPGMENVATYYNHRQYTGDATKAPKNYFHISKDTQGTVDQEYVDAGVEELTNDAFDWLLNPFRKVNESGMTEEQREAALVEAEKQLGMIDSLSVRAYLMLVGAAARKLKMDTRAGSVTKLPLLHELIELGMKEKLGYPASVTQWLETTNTGTTGWYDEGLMQTVLEMADFDAQSIKYNDWVPEHSPLKKTEWVCIDGGSEMITDAMFKYLDIKSKDDITKRKVSAIKQTGDHKLAVTFSHDSKASEIKKYDQVICTATLGCIASMDLGDCLSYAQQVAVRSLQYDASCKIGIKFKTRWWQDPNFMPEGKTIYGGVSHSDLPLSNVVYPSYGADDTNAPGVLIASYTWAQDAKRLGALIGEGGKIQGELLDLVMRNLALIHAIDEDKLREQLVDSYAHAWYNDPFYRGAFAIFGPAQFSELGGTSLFDSIKVPAAGGRLHIAGEATSTHHGWIIGALNSAWRAVYQTLGGVSDKKEMRAKLIEKYGVPDEEGSEDDLQDLKTGIKVGVHGVWF